jgi:hypothetical protein
MKNKPCAFCGSTEKDNPRTKGHVLQDSMYPESGFEKVQRITVPECRRCGGIWKDAEDNFRSLMALCAIGKSEQATAKWDGPIRRAHDRQEDGQQRIHELLKWVVTTEMPEGEDARLHPSSVENINIVLRKMVRGLCHFHKLGTQIHDEAVLVLGEFENQLPGEMRKKAMEFNHLPGVFRYAYLNRRLEPDTFHVTWFLCFYEIVGFIVLVSAPRVKGFADLPL